MRLSSPILLLAILSACSTTPPEEQGTTAPAVPVNGAPVEWPGYYEGLFPRGRGRETVVQLWVRSDSTFIIRQRLVDADTLAEGSIGTWRIVQVSGGPASGLLSIQYGGDPPDHYQRSEKGLVFVDVIGGMDMEAEWILERSAGDIQDEIPRMRLTGTFTYMADAMSFKPCGSRFSWPCAGGEQWTEEGEVLGSLNTVELERNYLKSVKQGGDPWLIAAEVTLAMGPAMEGDGADEYIFIHRVLKEAGECP